jgi:hypothetical protein
MLIQLLVEGVKLFGYRLHHRVFLVQTDLLLDQGDLIDQETDAV